MSKITDTIRAGIGGAVGLAGKAIVASATMALPILKLPVIKQVFEWIVNWVLSRSELQPFLTNFFVDLAIDIERNAKKEAYEQVVPELKAELKRHIRDPKKLKAASDAFDKRFDELVRIRP